MKRLKSIGGALLALFALGAIVASSASAVDGFLPLSIKTFIFLGKNWISETHNKEQIKCETLGGSGAFENDHHGTALFDFLGCEVVGFPTFSLGEKTPKVVKEALILVPVLFLICLIDSAKKTFGIFFELKGTIHLQVNAIGDLIEVKGSVIAELLTTKGKLFVSDLNGKEGLGNIKECKDAEGTVKKALLLSEDHSIGKVFLELSDKVAAGLIQFTEEQELMA